MGGGGGGARRHEGDGRLGTRAPLRPPRRSARVLRQPAPALHGLEEPQHRHARGGAAARALDLRVRRPRRARPARRSRTGTRRSCTSSSATSSSRRSCARTPASWRRRAKGRCRSSSSCVQLKGDLHAHTTWSADGHNTVEEMALAAIERGYEYLAITDHSHYLREGRMEAQDREIDARQRELAPFRLLKGVEVEHPRGRLARRAGRGARRARLGRGVDPLGASSATRRTGCAARWRTRTSTASAT